MDAILGHAGVFILWPVDWRLFDIRFVRDPLGVSVVVRHARTVVVCAVGIAGREEPQRAAGAADDLVGAVEVHPFLRGAMDALWLVQPGRRAVRQCFHGLRMDPARAVPPDRRLRVCRRDSRALQDIFLMSSTTRQVTRVL